MPEKNTRFILANGEKFVSSIEKKGHGGPSAFPRSYEEARGRLIEQIKALTQSIEEMPKSLRLPGEVVACLRMHPNFIAKSYEPESLFLENPNLSTVGARSYPQIAKEVAPTPKVEKVLQVSGSAAAIPSRMIFVQGTDEGFRGLAALLNRAESQTPANFRDEVRRIERFDLLTADEQLAAFDRYPEWTEGRVELVLHPSRYSTDLQMEFIHELFSHSERVLKSLRSAPYPNGPTFISCRLTRDDIAGIAGANPLRTAHPLLFKGFEELRSSSVFKAPPPPNESSRSRTTVGLFDGGLNPDHPHLRGHVEQDESLSIVAPAIPAGIAHGTAVAGALLYGALNKYALAEPLPTPPVSVVSFRVLPTSDPQDIDLFESIDIIEKVVPIRKDISVFNISFGPRGPIEEDSISRFTFALDLLAHTHNVTFCVAVGNDGDAGPELGRIQAPSDLVNGLGVGAFSESGGKRYAASYSCIGPGREGAKAKPDLVAFGGCDQTPIHLLSADSANKALSAGTSFSTPQVSALAARAISEMDHGHGNSLLARALLIHSAKHPDERPDHNIGYGFLSESLEEMLSCGKNEVSILFQGQIPVKKWLKLPFLLPADLPKKGKLEFRWTVGISTEVDPNQASDYTKVCIEDTFYPNSKRYQIRPPKSLSGAKPRTVHLVGDEEEIARLAEEGWELSQLPVTESGNVHLTEDNRRINLKWEPMVRRRSSKMTTSVDSPFLVLHAIPRGGFLGKIKYAAVVTIRPTADVDLYQLIRKKNPVLQPIRLRAETELRVRV